MFLNKRKKKFECGDDDDDISLNLDNDHLVQQDVYISKIYTINLDKDIGTPDEYRPAFHVLRKACAYDVINLVINTEGGYVNTTTEFFNYLLNCQATTIAEVHCAYSAGAIIALACDEVNIARFGSMMIHSMTTASFGKVHELDQHLHFIDRFCSNIIHTVFDQFLTHAEIQAVIKGKDMWLFEEEINDRLKHWTPIRKRSVPEKKEVKKKHGKETTKRLQTVT